MRILIGGSPCTHWSIAKSNRGRESHPSGAGWELFKNYLIAKEKFKPDYFLYENNKSASKPIKQQISKELGVDLQYIDSALVSAQRRQRFYAHNIPNVPQPRDRGLVLKDILLDEVDEKYYLSSKIQQRFKRTKENNVNNYGVGTTKPSYRTIGQRDIVFGNNQKMGTLLASDYKQPKQILVQKPIRIGDIGTNSQAHRVYSTDGKSVCINANGGGLGVKTGLYEMIERIRKLTPMECERLQTMPDNYTSGLSDTQRYKCLGNGWTAEVIKHILKRIPMRLNEPVEVLSMYDGIATGYYCMDSLGWNIKTYKAYEIDKYAIKVAQNNYPQIIQCGDAFQVRNNDWRY